MRELRATLPAHVFMGDLPAHVFMGDLPAHVFMTTDSVGGIWSYAIDLARLLAGRDVAVTLAVLGPALSADQADEASGVPLLEVLETGLPLDWLAPDADAVLAAGGRLIALADRSGADIVHLNNPAYAAAGRFTAPMLAFCHSCVGTWWDAIREGAPPADFAWRITLTAAGYRNADRLAAPSAVFAQETARRYGLALPEVVHNGRAALPRTHTGLALPARFAFTAGRLWDEGKNVAVLDRAAGRMRLPVLVAGATRGPDGAAVDFAHLRTMGRLDPAGVAACLAARPVFVSPSRYEPFGLAVLEAAQAGCALVLADLPGFRELWGEAADYVAADDDCGLAVAIERLAEDDTWRRERGEAASRRAGRFTPEAMLAGTLGLYRSLLAVRQAVPA